MKNLIAHVLTPLLLAVLLLAADGSAQYAPRIFKVAAPFEFTVDGQAFPAGNYTIVRVAPDRLQLRGAQGHVLTSVLTHSVAAFTAPTAPKLQFSTENGGHALTQIWLGNERIGYELATPRAGTALAKRHANGSEQAARSGNQP